MYQYYSKDLKDMGKTTKSFKWHGWAILVLFLLAHSF